jgi:hypothetical protein
MQRFEVEAIVGEDGNAAFSVYCPVHGWWVEVPAPTTLGELVQRAEEHTEVCR